MAYGRTLKFLAQFCFIQSWCPKRTCASSLGPPRSVWIIQFGRVTKKIWVPKIEDLFQLEKALSKHMLLIEQTFYTLCMNHVHLRADRIWPWIIMDVCKEHITLCAKTFIIHEHPKWKNEKKKMVHEIYGYGVAKLC